MVDFRLLGPVEVWEGDRRVDVGHAKQRCVLAVLLAEVGQVVSTATLLDRVWANDPPEGASNVLYPYVARLRKALKRLDVPLVRRSGGYLLDVAPNAVDMHRFRWLLAEADAMTELDQIAAKLDTALTLWHGEALGGITGRWAVEVRELLADERLSAVITRNEAYLRRGRHTELVGSLRELLASRPDDERLTGQLMVALYRSGRSAEAREQYRSTRRHLAAQHGSTPSPYLRGLHQRILRDDPALTQATPPARTADPIPAGLPPDIPDFVDRRAELSALDDLLPATAASRTILLVALYGTPGVGKTTLAVHWAHRVKARFPDGNLYANLQGHGPGQPADPGHVLDGFLIALGVASHRIPDNLDAKSTLYRTLLNEQKMLVVLDNAATPEQVRPLLPGSPGCLVIVTSRTQLTGLIAVEGARPLTLQLFSPSEAHEFLARRLGPKRVAAEPDAVQAIISHSAQLPLALAVVAARAASRNHFSLSTLAAELSDTRGRLDALAGGDVASDVRAVLSWSYQALTAQARQLFRLLGLHPGPDISAAAAAHLLGHSVRETRKVLAELARAHLIREHIPGRYGFHDLLRVYAGEQAEATDSVDERNAALSRELDHYFHTACQAAAQVYPHERHRLPRTPNPTAVTLPDSATASRWLDDERANLIAIAHHPVAGENRPGNVIDLVAVMREYLICSGFYVDAQALYRRVLAVATRHGDRAGEAAALNALAIITQRLGGYAQAASISGRLPSTAAATV